MHMNGNCLQVHTCTHSQMEIVYKNMTFLCTCTVLHMVVQGGILRAYMLFKVVTKVYC